MYFASKTEFKTGLIPFWQSWNFQHKLNVEKYCSSTTTLFGSMDRVSIGELLDLYLISRNCMFRKCHLHMLLKVHFLHLINYVSMAYLLEGNCNFTKIKILTFLCNILIDQDPLFYNNTQLGYTKIKKKSCYWVKHRRMCISWTYNV